MPHQSDEDSEEEGVCVCVVGVRGGGCWFPSELTLDQHGEEKSKGGGEKEEKMKFPLGKQCFLIKMESVGRLTRPQ